MTSSYTTNKGLEKPGYNDYVNSWNVPLNSDMDVVDSSLGSTYSIALTNANVNLTQTNCQNARIKLTGLLSANVTIYFPAGVGGFFIVQNTTTGAYTVTLASAGGGTYVTASGGGGVTQSTFIFSDGTNITFADDLRLQLNAGAGISISAGNNPTISNTGVLSFNTRAGAVTLSSGDVTGALGYTPPTPTGSGASVTWNINITGNAGTVTNGVYNTGGTYNINITGNSASVTNGVYNNGGTYSINVTGSAGSASYATSAGNASTVTNGVYNNGGTYNINVTGNAASATNASYATTAGSATTAPVNNFGAIGSYVFGLVYLQYQGSSPGAVIPGSVISCYLLNTNSAVNPPSGSYMFAGAGSYTVANNLFQRVA